MSTQRSERSSPKGKGPNGRNICRCGCGRESSPPRRNWFSQECVDAWKERNDITTIRRKVYKRDKGICAQCGINTDEAQWLASETLNRLSWSEQSEFRHLIIPPGFPSDLCRDWWEADHIVPVVRGGGQCGLEGYRTLCVPCHKRETARLASERAAERQATKRARDPQLQLVASIK